MLSIVLESQLKAAYSNGLSSLKHLPRDGGTIYVGSQAGSAVFDDHKLVHLKECHMMSGDS